ncbi:MAG: 3-deoxy-manno-octulosonate cytidylyltransferase [Gammaproteobacteria bacterium]|nr:3-deoxy-manno-octulosonate cytidylyltransferase [Gammaproteobacteria bacterium]
MSAATPFSVIIPARFASTRLPGKPLRLIAGKTMIEWVYAAARASGGARVVVATDDARIEAAVEAFGGEACLTAPEHTSGTERLSEVVRRLQLGDEEIVVNLQGDEPLMPPQLLQQVATLLQQRPQAEMATLCTPIRSYSELVNPNVVKVVTDCNDYALYFSRAPIPWDRDHFLHHGETLPPAVTHLRHLGLYSYRGSFLRNYPESRPSPLEQRESLEQLRLLWLGGKIAVAEALQLPGPGVDTEEELLRVAQQLERAL